MRKHELLDTFITNFARTRILQVNGIFRFYSVQYKTQKKFPDTAKTLYAYVKVAALSAIRLMNYYTSVVSFLSSWILLLSNL
jgi:Rps23 Pro-64 3,4-dihydroxylase Tpa1-like proline 4-hydroxylase